MHSFSLIEKSAQKLFRLGLFGDERPQLKRECVSAPPRKSGSGSWSDGLSASSDDVWSIDHRLVALSWTHLHRLSCNMTTVPITPLHPDAFWRGTQHSRRYPPGPTGFVYQFIMTFCGRRPRLRMSRYAAWTFHLVQRIHIRRSGG